MHRTRSLASSGGMTRLNVAPLSNRGSIPAKGKRFFIFFPDVLTARGFTQPPTQYVSQGVKRRGVKLTTDLHIQLSSRTNGVRPPSLRLWFYDVLGENYYSDVVDSGEGQALASLYVVMSIWFLET
jgi:hypothetical protein